MSVSFNSRSDVEMASALEIASKPLTLILKIENRFINILKGIGANRYSYGKLCDACGGYLGKEYYNFNHNNHQYQICNSCIADDREERLLRKHSITTILNSAVLGYAKAIFYKPSNKIARKNYETTLELAQKMGLSLTTEHLNYFKPETSSFATSTTTRSKKIETKIETTKSPDFASVLITALVISGLIVTMIILYLLRF